MIWFRSNKKADPSPDCAASILYDEKTFYNRLIQDLLEAKEEVIIESPFITTKRLNMLKPYLEKLINRGVKIFIFTRPPQEHDESMIQQSEAGINYFEALGIEILLCVGNHHRKLAMIDRRVLWEGSLNILSQTHSREIMRRIESKKLTEEMFEFLKLDRFI